MAEVPTLTPRELNRALLERQLLRERRQLSALAAVEHLVGLQAQDPKPPYLALWSRLQGFRPEELSTAMIDRTVLRTWVMRFTIHLVTAADAVAIRPVVQPALLRSLLAAYRRDLDGVDLELVAEHGRDLLERQELTNTEVGHVMAERWPDHDPRVLGNAVRALVPAAQVTPRGVWGASGEARHTTVERWLGRPVSTDATPDPLVVRYLAAFGPATAADVRTWSGLTGVGPILDRLRPRLVTFRDDAGRELFDLPDAPRPDADTPVPVRLLPRFDNVLLSHADRRRIVDEVHRPVLASRNGMPPPTFLVDGFVAGTWRIDVTGHAAALRLRPFERLQPRFEEQLLDEATGMLRFVSGEPTADDVRLLSPAMRAC